VQERRRDAGATKNACPATAFIVFVLGDQFVVGNAC
jgi:hypothetical protein